MRDYAELILDLRRHHCDAKEDDTQEVCEECAYDVIISDKSKFSGITDVCTCGLMHRAADAIEELQTEKAKIENSGKLIAAAFERLKEKVPKWIPVEERLPDDDRAFLVSIHDDSGDGAFDYTDVGWIWIGENGDRLFVVDNQPCSFVTHWMPLPAPPKGVE